MKQERSRGSRLSQHSGRPDYKAGNRRANGQYHNARVCRSANLPRRARRGV